MPCLSMLFKLDDIEADEPVSGCQREVDSVCGLCLKCILHEIDVSYQ